MKQFDVFKEIIVKEKISYSTFEEGPLDHFI